MTESEWRTRKTRVNQRLKQAGWPPLSLRDGVSLSAYGTAAVEEYPTGSGPADYLLADSGVPLAAVEAKKVSLGPRNALTQAIRYARDLSDSPFDFAGIKVP